MTNTREKYGGYGGVFTALLKAGAKHIELPESSLQLTAYDVVGRMEYPNLEDIDGILMTGSSM